MDIFSYYSKLITHTLGSPTNAANTMPRAKSSLTPQQVTHLKDQLTEILDTRSSKYEIQVNPSDKKATAKSNLFVKPLTEFQQKALMSQIGQEIKTRNQQQPRVCTEYNQSKERVDETNDFLLVLTSPSQNEEVQATMENWATKEEPPRPRSVTEIAKSFEEGLNNENLPKPLTPTRQIESNLSVEQVKKSFEQLPTEEITVQPNLSPTLLETELSVEEVKKSFEKLPDSKNDDDVEGFKKDQKSPQRTESFCKAIQGSLGKLSKSTSSLENVLDEDRSLNPYNDISMSNPDISDNESKVRRPRSRMQESRSGFISPYGTVQDPSAKDQTKYSRAYLTLVKSGDVTNKLTKFDPNHFPKGYSYKIIQQSKKMSKDEVDKKVTNTSRINIKAKEYGHVQATLEKFKAKSNLPPLSESNDPGPTWIDPATVPPKSLTWTDQKAKLKHFCKKMSHSRILSKMMALQGQNLDKGTEKLMNKTNQEDLLKSVYQGGQVESKVDWFEKPCQRPLQSPGPEWAYKSETSFSWSKRLNPEDQTSLAQRHNQFRKYYGYHPAEQSPALSLDMNKPLRGQVQQEPASLPLFLENLPPPPPIRTNTLTKGANF